MKQKINNSKPSIWSLSFNFRFSGEKSQSQLKLAKKITQFTNLYSLNLIKKYTPATQPKTLLTLQNFLANVFLVGVRKNICSAPFLDAQELHSQSNWKVNVCIFLQISVGNFLFQRSRELLSGGAG